MSGKDVDAAPALASAGARNTDCRTEWWLALNIELTLDGVV